MARTLSKELTKAQLSRFTKMLGHLVDGATFCFVEAICVFAANNGGFYAFDTCALTQR